MPSIWPQRRNPLEDRVLRRRRTPASALPGLGECNLLINDNDQSKLLTDDGGSGDILRLDGGAFVEGIVSQPATAYIEDEISALGNPGVNTGTRHDTFWRQDGLKVFSIFVYGSPAHAERQFSVSPAWGIDSGDWTLEFTSGVGSTNNRSIWWSPDGTFFSRCRRIVATSLSIQVYDQSATPWDFTVLGPSTFKAWTPTGGATPQDHIWSDDGLRLWIVTGLGARIDEYAVGTAWDASTIVSAQIKSFAIGSVNSVAFAADGKQLYLTAGNALRSRPLSIAFDIDTLGSQVIGPTITPFRVNIPRGLTYRNGNGDIVAAGDQGSSRRLSFLRIP